MVSTRSHDHAVQSVDTNSQRRKSSPESNSKKRKLAHETDDTPSKSRKPLTTEEKAVAVVIAQSHYGSEKKQLPERPRAKAEGGREAPSKISGTLHSGVRGEDENAVHANDIGPLSIPEKVPNSPEASEMQMEGRDRSSEQSGLTLKKSGSEEVDALIEEGTANAEVPEHGAPHDVVEDVDSDDEAPEEAVTAAGQDKIGAAAAKAAELAMKEETARKARRKEHDGRMRAQAKGAKNASSKKRLAFDQGIADEATEARSSILRTEKHRKTILPALLPEEVLNAEPANRLPTPPRSSNKPQVKVKRMLLLNGQDKPPKDLVLGNTKIRILQQERTTLPPPSSTKGRGIREKWLLGQRGDKPAMWVPRQKPSSGFVRKLV